METFILISFPDLNETSHRYWGLYKNKFIAQIQSKELQLSEAIFGDICLSFCFKEDLPIVIAPSILGHFSNIFSSIYLRQLEWDHMFQDSYTVSFFPDVLWVVFSPHNSPSSLPLCYSFIMTMPKLHFPFSKHHKPWFICILTISSSTFWKLQ